MIAGHFYEIRVNHRRRPELPEDSRFRVALGDSSLAEITASASDWKELKVVGQASVANPELIFEELTNNGFALGTLIHSIRLYDLGAGP